MKAMESGSSGWWRPSPGSVYPMLEHLTKEGLVHKRDSDSRYEITPQGREESEWPSRLLNAGQLSVERVLDDISNNTSYLEDLAQVNDPKLQESSKQIRELAGRLTKLGGTG